MRIVTILLAALGFCLFASSCITTETGKADAKPAEAEPTGENISVGMTKSQVRRAWGEPSGTDVTARGEIWVYGNQNALRLIPYAGPWLNVNTRKVMFNSSGRVVDFRNTNSGNVYSQGEGMGGSRFSDF